MTCLVIAEHDNAELKPSTLSTVQAAAEIGGDIHILVAGSGCAAVADQAAKVAGVTSIKVADDAQYEHQLAEPVAALVISLSGDYTHILASATTFGKNFMPRVSALLDMAQISDISAVVSADTFVRPIYAGNALATVQSNDAIKLITVRGSTFDKAAYDGGSASVDSVSASENPGVSTFISQELSKSERPELTSASIVISGGRGVGSSENFAIIEALADKLGAAVGASRAAVDAGYVPNDYQVGQTGKIVAPDLYVAIGISGAIQHLAGMKDSKVIVAINKDEEAPIFQIADYGLVGDLFDVVPQLSDAL
ncbi:MAG: electron transfer flavoprotein subunit alpha/FixB family protein [Planktomarina sp.]|nr:electron transfer flavoprotein subunit alpha/FixB family protein [Planktomarina sp.]